MTALTIPDTTQLDTRASGIEAQAASLVVHNEATANDAAGMLGLVAAAKREVEQQRVDLVKPLNDHVKKINDKFRPLLARLEALDGLLRGKVSSWRRAEQEKVEAARREAEEARRKAEAEERARLEAVAQAEREQRETAERAERARRDAEEAQRRAAEAEGKKAKALAAKLAAEAAERQRVADEKARAAEAAKLAADAAQAQAEADAVFADAPAPVPVAPPKTIGGVTARRRWVFEVVEPLKVPRAFLRVEEKLIRAAVADGVREIAGVHIYETEDLAVHA